MWGVTINNAKVGLKVGVQGGHTLVSDEVKLMTVAKITARMIVLDDGSRFTHYGRQWGHSTGYYGSHLVTEEEAKRSNIERGHDNRRKQIASYVKNNMDKAQRILLAGNADDSSRRGAAKLLRTMADRIQIWEIPDGT